MVSDLQVKCKNVLSASPLNRSMDPGKQELPFWGHFAVVAVAQYHTVLFLVLLSNGLSYVLGICNDAGYMGLNRGILWWPIADPSNPCEL